ncbi:MAG: hypothetical protein JWO38_6852 [Gemmataceae bacterium]|nr:hypothetical protein [Gemmataceae bacterium]
MSEYHTREAFEARMAERRANPRPPDPAAVFYHIACLPGWEPIVGEQLAVLAHVGLTTVQSAVLGTQTEARRVREIAQYYGVSVEILDVIPDPGRYEQPTLQAAHAWARANPGGMVIYFHTKGVSARADEHKRQWRRVMQRYVVADWRENRARLAVADILGCAWQESVDYPHFCGNFWAARCDWLAGLDPPDQYRLSRSDFRWAGAHSWRDRMFVETWLGSQGWHHVDDRIGKSTTLWNERVWTFDPAIPGFDYDQIFPGDPAGIAAAGQWVRPDPALRDVQGQWDAAGIPRATGHEEMAYIADGIARVTAAKVPGVVLECGAWTGFSSACLSIACARHGRRLVVADSFAGLPVPAEPGYAGGQFACTQDRWQANLQRFGRPEVTQARPGWYAETLPTWAEPVAVLWMDVDLGESVRVILDRVLPWLSPGGLIYTHESHPSYFRPDGTVGEETNLVWRAIKKALGGRLYRARFLCGSAAELEIR